jgi:hypothetical protein
MLKVEVEEILKRDRIFAGCTVKFGRFDELSRNRFVVYDAAGKFLIYLEEWEVEILDDDELLEYAKVKKIRAHDCQGLSGVAYLLLFVSSVLLGSLVIVLFLVSIVGFSSSAMVAIQQISILIIGLSIVFSYSERKKKQSRKREVDFDVARNSASFHSAIRKLASQPESDEVKTEEYVKRLNYIEDLLAGIRP